MSSEANSKSSWFPWKFFTLLFFLTIIAMLDYDVRVHKTFKGKYRYIHLFLKNDSTASNFDFFCIISASKAGMFLTDLGVDIQKLESSPYTQKMVTGYLSAKKQALPTVQRLSQAVWLHTEEMFCCVIDKVMTFRP